MRRSIAACTCVVIALCTTAFGYYAWQWDPGGPNDCMFDDANPPVSDYWLSKNNGSRAVAMSSDAYWTSVAAECRHRVEAQGQVPAHWSYDSVLAFEWKGNAHWNQTNGGREWPYVVWDEDHEPGDPCVLMNDYYKLWMCSEYKQEDYRCMAAWDELDDQEPSSEDLTENNHVNYDHCLAGAYISSTGQRTVAAYSDNFQNSGPNWGLPARRSTSRGQSWDGPWEVAPYQNEADQPKAPSLAMTSNWDVCCAYQLGANEENPEIMFKKDPDSFGRIWGSGTGTKLGDGSRPCIATAGPFIFACWHEDNRIVYRFSRDAATT
jgi:hypothetical protein